MSGGPAGDEHDDLDDDAEPLGAPPHPMDRVWRHPSELPPVERPRRRPPRGPARQHGPWWMLAASAGAGAIVTVALLAAFGVFDDASPNATVAREQRVRVEDQAVATLAAEIAPSIVTVAAITPEGARRGSGVCVRHAGDILTSDRLVRGATKVLVTTHDGTTRPATVRGHDPDTDLALLHVGTGLQAAPISESSVQPGDTVLAVGGGNTNDNQPWIGDGIVSSVDGSVTEAGGPAMDGLIATNASPGEHGLGGALLDRKGNVAGILVAPVAGDTSTYAVPIALAAKVASQLDTAGVATHGWLGVHGVDVFGVPVVTSMAADSPAAHGGMRIGDVVVAIDGKQVTTMGDVVAAIRWYPPSTSVVVKVQRGSILLNMHVVLGATGGAGAETDGTTTGTAAGPVGGTGGGGGGQTSTVAAASVGAS